KAYTYNSFGAITKTTETWGTQSNSSIKNANGATAANRVTNYVYDVPRSRYKTQELNPLPARAGQCLRSGDRFGGKHHRAERAHDFLEPGRLRQAAARNPRRRHLYDDRSLSLRRPRLMPHQR